jgi:protein-S-isoprenylcysteine O-methyltransferase Ste14
VRRLKPILGTIAFFIVAPGSVAGLIPYLLTGWEMRPPLLGLGIFRWIGALLLVIGAAGLVECFARFALVGFGTPAPIAPPKHLVVSGLYRYVRNPMYVCVLAAIVGEALILGQTVLLTWAAIGWTIVHVWVLTYEEPNLRERFGANYEEYCRHVRRWWPRLQPFNGRP